MGRPSKIKALPPDLVDEINGLLVARGFSGYEALADWLRQEKGVEISRASLQRHGAALEEEFAEAMADARRTTALARAAQQAGDHADGALMSAAAGILQDGLLRTSLALRRASDSEDDPAATAKTLSTLARAFADVGRMDIANQKWVAETRAKLTALEAEAGSGKRALDAETLRIVREEIYGA